MYIRVGCDDRSVHRRSDSTRNRRDIMSKKSKWMSAALAVTAFSTLAMISLSTVPAEAAVVYCKTAGVPQGCVVRPIVPAAAIVAVRPMPVAAVGVTHVGFTRVTPYGVRHVGYNRFRAWR
jgi:FtsH-binding integral membrane protein